MTEEVLLPIVAAVFGLVFGSFLNVCIYRLPRGLSVATPPSRCAHVWQHPALVRQRAGGQLDRPARALRLLRRHGLGAVPDRGAGHRLAFALIAWLTSDRPAVPGPLVLACVLIVLFGIDLEHQILPNVITLPGIVVGFAFSAGRPPGWRDSLHRILLGGGVLYAVADAYYRSARKRASGWAT